MGATLTLSQVLWALAAILAVQAITGMAVVGLGRRESFLARSLPYLVSGAAGILLATACLDLLPGAVEASGSGSQIWAVLLISLLLLFCLQAGAHWLADEAGASSALQTTSAEYHSTAKQHESYIHVHGSPHAKPWALLLGSALHSLVDGIAIVAAFSASPRAGWSVALAVGLHELPHRMSDFALLLHLGIHQRTAMQFSILAGAAAIVGGVALACFGQHPAAQPVLLVVSAATFLYISLVDLIPELHAHRADGKLFWQVLALLGGAALMVAIIHLPGDLT